MAPGHLRLSLSLFLALGCNKPSDGEGEGDDGSTEVVCLSEDIIAALDEHLEDIHLSGDFLRGHPYEREATLFLLAPGLPKPPGSFAMFATLFEECSAATLFDQYCADGYCSQLECTGQGAGWIAHIWLEPVPLMSGGWSFASVRVENAWMDGAMGSTFTIVAEITGPEGADFSFTGSGTLDPDAVKILETFPHFGRGR